jgi:hypothetical protein
MATLIFEGETEIIPIDEAFQKAYALTSQGYSQIFRWSKLGTEITIYKESHE